MAFNWQDIKDMVVQYPNRYKIDGVSKTIEPDFGVVTEPGTPINKALLQRYEDKLNIVNTPRMKEQLFHARQNIASGQMLAPVTNAWTFSYTSLGGAICQIAPKRFVVATYKYLTGVLEVSLYKTVTYAFPELIHTLTISATTLTDALGTDCLIYAYKQNYALIAYKQGGYQSRDFRVVVYNPGTDRIDVTNVVNISTGTGQYYSEPAMSSSVVSNATGNIIRVMMQHTQQGGSYDYLNCCRFTLSGLTLSGTRGYTISPPYRQNLQYPVGSILAPNRTTLAYYTDSNNDINGYYMIQFNSDNDAYYTKLNRSVNIGGASPNMSYTFDIGEYYLFFGTQAGNPGVFIFAKDVLTPTLVKHVILPVTIGAYVSYNPITREFYCGSPSGIIKIIGSGTNIQFEWISKGLGAVDLYNNLAYCEHFLSSTKGNMLYEQGAIAVTPLITNPATMIGLSNLDSAKDEYFTGLTFY